MKERSPLAVKLGLEIRRQRLEQQRSQEAFADDCGINRTYMGNIERGEKVVSIDMIKRIVAGPGLTLGQFFTALGE